MLRWFSFMLVAMVFVVPVSAAADCVDINADPAERPVAVTHIDEERAVQLIAGRPRASVRLLTGINRHPNGNAQPTANKALDLGSELAS